MIRVQYLRAEGPADGGRGPAEVVQEVGKPGIPDGVLELNATQIIGAPLLSDKLSQELDSVAQSVASGQFGLRFLEDKVVTVVKLRVCECRPGAEMFEIEMGVATLERRPRRRGISGAGPVRCGIASSDQNLPRDKWPGVARWPPPFARSSACRSVPCGL